jgi:phage tail sheath protein FI
MAELTFRSAGVSTREIDLSQPAVTGPQGVPAGIIGTSLEGPAFIPLTVATFADFQTVFGQSDGEKFGPLAVNSWLRNARACTYIRVLGVGNGKKRATTGVVTNAGFTVGDQQVQASGLLSDNPYANSGVGAVEGRVHFLGCFMSESAGSTIFSSAGIQTSASGSAIMRGILLAPSGVVLTLSGNGAQGGANTPDSGNTATDGSSLIGRTGEISGSLDLSSQQFVMLLNGHKSTTSYPNVITASFDMTAPNYFAKVFNSDPLKAEESGHLLHAHYDVYPDLAAVTGSGVVTAGTYSLGSDEAKEDIVLLLTSSIARGNVDPASIVPVYESFEDRFASAETPYVISQDFGASSKDLFKVVLLSAGADSNPRYKFSIENINRVTAGSDLYGTFDLVVRDMTDTDDEKVVLESFRGLSLDPSSDRYITRVIGDQHVYYDFDTALDSQKIIVDGEYPVRSRYIRIQASTGLKNGNIPEDALPVGFRGPRHTVTSGSLLAGGVNAVYNVADAARSLREPPVPYRETVSLGVNLKKRSDARLYWGAQTTRKTSITEPNKAGLFEDSFDSFVKYLPDFRLDTNNFSVGDNAGVADEGGTILDSDRFNNNIFSLERIQVRTGSNGIADPEQWLSASYVRQGSIAADATAKTRAFRISDLDTVANRRFAKFTFFAQGGFDGTNIFNSDKSKLTNNAVKREIDDANQGETAGPTVSAYRKAVDVMGSKSDVEIQLLAIPGIRHSSVSDYAVSAIENRFDAMYVMDIEEKDKFNTVITSSAQQPNVTYTVNSFKSRALDTSFAAAYFPDIVVQDPTTLTNVSAPPSVAVMGAMSLNDAVGHPWFAPAGFTRGALDAVEFVSTRLNRDNLDDLYEADINPITAFPGTGVTVWGQKTLLANQSALDRINVRRLLIDVRRQVRNVANTLLFEPNREETLEKFTALVNPILQRVQDLSGVERYKVIIDTTTTTQADVENNTIRGKIFLQPTRTAEFVALDFVVTNAGAEI